MSRAVKARLLKITNDFMKVAVYYNNKDIRIQEMPKPRIGPNEVLFKVLACGICGSDVLEWYRIKQAPRVLGHEATGIIEQVGKRVEGYKKGDRVFISHHVPCEECRYCQAGHHTACETLHTTNFYPGGFSEFVRVPEINVKKGIYKLPDNISFEEGTLIEPLACVWRAQRLAGLKSGQIVLVLGSGVSGILHIQLANTLGAEKIIATDINDYRLKAAKRFGADAVINAVEDVPDRVLESGRKADIVIICTGAPSAVEQALKSVDRGGTVLFFAVPHPDKNPPIPLAELWRNEIRLMTSYGAAPGDLRKAVELIGTKRINAKDMITHQLPLEQAAEGFRLVAEAGNSLKVIIRPHPDG